MVSRKTVPGGFPSSFSAAGRLQHRSLQRQLHSHWGDELFVASSHSWFSDTGLMHSLPSPDGPPSVTPALNSRLSSAPKRTGNRPETRGGFPLVI